MIGVASVLQLGVSLLLVAGIRRSQRRGIEAAGTRQEPTVAVGIAVRSGPPNASPTVRINDDKPRSHEDLDGPQRVEDVRPKIDLNDLAKDISEGRVVERQLA